MTVGRGNYLQFGIIEEATYGTTPATPTMYAIPCAGINIGGVNRNLIDNPEYRGNRNMPKPVQGVENVSWSVTPTLHLDAIGWIQKHGIGDPATVDNSDGTWTHTSKIGFADGSVGALPAGLTAEVGETNIDEYFPFPGTKINTIGCTVTPEGVTTFDVGLISKSLPTAAQTSLDATPTTYTTDALSDFDVSLVQEGGSTNAIMTELSFTISNNLDNSLRTLASSGDLYALPETSASVTGSVSFLFEDDTQYDKAKAFTETSLQVVWTSGSHSLTIDFPEVILEPTGPQFGGIDQAIRQTYNFRSFYQNGADASACKWTLLNAVSDY